MRFDVAHFTEDEQLLVDRPLDEVLRRAAAISQVLAEEESAAVSYRPTVPVLHGEPWR